MSTDTKSAAVEETRKRKNAEYRELFWGTVVALGFFAWIKVDFLPFENEVLEARHLVGDNPHSIPCALALGFTALFLLRAWRIYRAVRKGKIDNSINDLLSVCPTLPFTPIDGYDKYGFRKPFSPIAGPFDRQSGRIRIDMTVRRAFLRGMKEGNDESELHHALGLVAVFYVGYYLSFMFASLVFFLLALAGNNSLYLYIVYPLEVLGVILASFTYFLVALIEHSNKELGQQLKDEGFLGTHVHRGFRSLLEKMTELLDRAAEKSGFRRSLFILPTLAYGYHIVVKDKNATSEGRGLYDQFRAKLIGWLSDNQRIGSQCDIGVSSPDMHFPLFAQVAINWCHEVKPDFDDNRLLEFLQETITIGDKIIAIRDFDRKRSADKVLHVQLIPHSSVRAFWLETDTSSNPEGVPKGSDERPRFLLIYTATTKPTHDIRKTIATNAFQQDALKGKRPNILWVECGKKFYDEVFDRRRFWNKHRAKSSNCNRERVLEEVEFFSRMLICPYTDDPDPPAVDPELLIWDFVLGRTGGQCYRRGTCIEEVSNLFSGEEFRDNGNPSIPAMGDVRTYAYLAPSAAWTHWKDDASGDDREVMQSLLDKLDEDAASDWKEVRGNVHFGFHFQALLFSVGVAEKVLHAFWEISQSNREGNPRTYHPGLTQLFRLDRAFVGFLILAELLQLRIDADSKKNNAQGGTIGSCFDRVVLRIQCSLRVIKSMICKIASATGGPQETILLYYQGCDEQGAILGEKVYFPSEGPHQEIDDRLRCLTSPKDGLIPKQIDLLRQVIYENKTLQFKSHDDREPQRILKFTDLVKAASQHSRTNNKVVAELRRLLTEDFKLRNKDEYEYKSRIESYEKEIDDCVEQWESKIIQDRSEHLYRHFESGHTRFAEELIKWNEGEKSGSPKRIQHFQELCFRSLYCSLTTGFHGSTVASVRLIRKKHIRGEFKTGTADTATSSGPLASPQEPS